MRLGYLYSRYPVISQTFCDAEMLALERLCLDLTIGSIYPPLTSLRHEHISSLRAPVHYAPPQDVLRISEINAKIAGRWPSDLVEQHEHKYGPTAKAALRARNALYSADSFARNEVDHVHVHFANRAAHTALFLKKISGIPFSVTAHGQDFMKDLGSDDLLREICAAAEFVAAETDYSRELLCARCPDSAAKIHRVYNGMDLERFPAPHHEAARPRHGAQAMVAPYHVPRIISVGRLVAFKGFDDLIDARAALARPGFDFTFHLIRAGRRRSNTCCAMANCGYVTVVPDASGLSSISELKTQLLHSLNCSRHHRFLPPNHITTALRIRRRSPGRFSTRQPAKRLQESRI